MYLSFLDGRALGPYRFLMKYLFLIAIISCAHRPPLTDKKDDLVHVSTVMDQVQASYLKGCADAFGMLKIPRPFETCRDKAILHRQEIQSILDQDPR